MDVTPSTIDLSVDTFELNIVLTNIGSAFLDTFELSIQRFFPNGNDSTYFIQVPGLLFRDTIQYKMASNHSIAVGLNNFTIKADLPLSISLSILMKLQTIKFLFLHIFLQMI